MFWKKWREAVSPVPVTPPSPADDAGPDGPPPPAPAPVIGPAAARVVELLGLPGWEPLGSTPDAAQREADGRRVVVSASGPRTVYLIVDGIPVHDRLAAAELAAIRAAAGPVFAATNAARAGTAAPILADLAAGRI